MWRLPLSEALTCVQGYRAAVAVEALTFASVVMAPLAGAESRNAVMGELSALLSGPAPTLEEEYGPEYAAEVQAVHAATMQTLKRRRNNGEGTA